MAKANQRPKAKARSGCLGFVALLVVIGIIGGVIGALAGGGPVSSSQAITNVMNAIDSGPSWETPEMSAAVSADINSSNIDDGCAKAVGPGNSGFACYLSYQSSSDPEANSLGIVNLYFAEDRDGGHIHPITARQYNDLTGGADNAVGTSSGSDTSSSANTSAGVTTTSSTAASTPSSPSPTGPVRSCPLFGDTSIQATPNVGCAAAQTFVQGVGNCSARSTCQVDGYACLTISPIPGDVSGSFQTTCVSGSRKIIFAAGP